MAITVHALLRSRFSLGAGMLGVVCALLYVTRDNPPWSAAVLAASMTVFVWIIVNADFADAVGLRALVPEDASGASQNWAAHRQAPIWLLIPAFLTTIATGALAGMIGQESVSGRTVVGPWLLSVLLCFAAARSTSSERYFDAVSQIRPRSFTWPSLRAWGPWVGMLMVAAVPRLVWLDRFPTIVDADEGLFLLIAQESQKGTLPNPFGLGIFSHPVLYPVVQGWIAPWFGGDVPGHRILSALVGTIGVLATWRFGRLLLGPHAIVGAIILATMPLHLHFSRWTLNNITDPTTLLLALLFLRRAIKWERATDAVICGVMLALGWYGYYGARAFPAVIIVLLGISAADCRFGLRKALRTGSWTAGGFLTIAMPLIMAFLRTPSEFAGHLAHVSSLSFAGLIYDPARQLGLYFANLGDALLYPVAGNNHGFFRHEPPYVGWPLAILLVIGAATWVANMVRDRDARPIAWLVVPWLVLTAGIATTIPLAGHRYLVMTPVLARAAGSGLTALVHWIVAVERPSRHKLRVLATVVATGALAVLQVRWIAVEDRQLVTYSDTRTLTAWDLGWRLSHSPDGQEPRVLFAGAPAMFAHGFANLRFLADDIGITDVESPIATDGKVPSLDPGTILIIIAERIEERCAVEQAYPESTIAEVRARDGRLLYVAFFRDSLPKLSTATTPAQSTFVIVPSSAC